MANDFWKPAALSSAIAADEIERIYKEYAAGPAEPDVIVLVNGKCPLCKSDWITPYTECVECGFPKQLEDL